MPQRQHAFLRCCASEGYTSWHQSEGEVLAVHYKGRLSEGDREFMDTRMEGEPIKLTAGRGEDNPSQGLLLLALCNVLRVSKGPQKCNEIIHKDLISFMRRVSKTEFWLGTSCCNYEIGRDCNDQGQA